MRVEKVLGGKEALEDCGMSMAEELTVTECAVSSAGSLLMPEHTCWPPLDPGKMRHYGGAWHMLCS